MKNHNKAKGLSGSRIKNKIQMLAFLTICTFLFAGCGRIVPMIFDAVNNDENANVHITEPEDTNQDGPLSDSDFTLVDDGKEDSETNYTIIPHETEEIEFEKYDDGLMSMYIPKGWEVTICPGGDIVHYTFMVQNPENRNYQIYFNMKGEGYLASEEERQWYATYYPDSPFALMPAINPQNTEGVYSVFSQAVEVAGGPVMGDFVYPTINDFTVIDKLGNVPIGGDVVRASYVNESGEPCEGLFTSTPAVFSLYYVNAVNTYNSVFFTTPAGELVNWVDTINYCIGTITFSETFVEAYYGQEQAIVQNSIEIANINNETSNIITDGWENRQTEYDIMSQQQSDATLGYERVYDTETGEVYQAYNGFMDEYDGERYDLISDEHYSLPVAGYIER